MNMCGQSCNTTDDSYVRVCVPNKGENINVKVFDLIFGVNETKLLVQQENTCNSKQKWNYDKYWCKCKELEDRSSSTFTYRILIHLTVSVIKHVKLVSI